MKDQSWMPQIMNVIMSAYNSGLLQWHPMSIYGIDVTVKFGRSYNTVTMTDGKITSSIKVYDEDSEFAQEASIESVLKAMFS